MIAFDLRCGSGHRFEGWFSSSGDFDAQLSTGLLACPVCNDPAIAKALSAPNVGRKGNCANSNGSPVLPPAIHDVANVPTGSSAMLAMMEKMAAVQDEMLKESQWVGREFAETARAIYYGETGDRLIHGETSPDEADALADEGIRVATLPFPVIPPDAKN